MKKPRTKLRRVIDWGGISIKGHVLPIWYELLECGHIIRTPTDIFGETSADRRRCRKCVLGLPADPKIDDNREYTLQESSSILYANETNNPVRQ